MQSIGHIDAVPGIGFHRKVDDISGLRVDSDKMQDMVERHTDPLGDIRPALFTCEFGDMAARGIARKLGKRERRRVMDHAIYGEPPACETPA